MRKTAFEPCIPVDEDPWVGPAASIRDRSHARSAAHGGWHLDRVQRRWGTKSKPIPGPHLVYGFLTTAPNAVVEPIHQKAMPVILTTDEERDVWMRAAGGLTVAIGHHLFSFRRRVV
jgi:hypothetical protein